MPNACFFVGRVDNIPDLEMGEDKERRVTFNLDLSFQGKNYGWIRVICLGENAEYAAKLHIATKVARLFAVKKWQIIWALTRRLSANIIKN